jgi:hypothetical protein
VTILGKLFLTSYQLIRERSYSQLEQWTDAWNRLPDEIKKTANQEDRKRLKNSNFLVPEELRPKQRQYTRNKHQLTC